MNRATLGWVVIAAFGIGFAGYAVYQRGQTPPPVAISAAPPSPAAPPGASLLEGLGAYAGAFTTGKPETQRWFDQGLMLAYGFNHDAAERSFLKAAELDPDCVMCWWGAALVLGPHVNAVMDPANNAKAWTRVQKALVLAPKAGAREQAYVQSLAARYAESPPADRKPLDEAYAKAVGDLVKQFPDDLDAATLFAEALMDLQPWDYYDQAAKPKGRTAEFLAALESVMARNPDHPGALHLYIHAVEASTNPERGAVAADRLRELVPGSGHLVHMPAHIYTRVGRYHDAVVANQKAIESDNVYLATCKPAPGMYPLGYVPHNHHFLWWAASMEGASAMALAAAEETAKRAWLPDLIKAPDFAFLQDYWMTPMKAKVFFSRWDAVQATPEPPADMPYPVAIWHFGQGMAAARQGRAEDAQKHLDVLAKTAADPAMEKLMIGPQHALSGTLRVAERVLAGEVAVARKDLAAAISALEQGVVVEDQQAYFEPPVWHQPVRQSLGAMLLQAGQAKEAEAVYREDLRRNRDNGWSLHGLAQSLQAQGKAAEAAEIEGRLQKAWAHADVKPDAARL